MKSAAVLLVLIAAVAVASAQTVGNVWHLPRSIEPAGVAGMRNPPYGILTSNSVTLYNGSYSLDGNQSAGNVWYRVRGAATYSSASMVFDTQNGANKYWRVTLPANSFPLGATIEYFFEIDFTDRATTYLYGTDTASQRSITMAVAATNPYTFRVTMPWPGGTTAGYPSDPADRIWHWKEEAIVGNGYMTVQLDASGSVYDIYYPSVGNRQSVSTANEGYRGPEEFPACPLDQEANGQMNVINGMGGLAVNGAIYWMKNQTGGFYSGHTQHYVTNNNVVYTAFNLNVPSNNVRVEQFDFCPVPSALPIVSGGRTNYGVYVKRFLLTNLEATARTNDFYFDMNFNVNGGNDHDAIYFDTTSNRNTMVVYDNTYREVTGSGCGPNGYGNEYKPASYAGNYVKNISVFFGTALKLTTNSTSGSPADAAWRDHTFSDNQEGWIAKRIVLPPNQTVEMDVLIVGSWDDTAGQAGTHDYWGRPIVDWFYTNNMGVAQTTTETYWSNWLASGVTVQLPDERLNALWNRSLLVSALHVDQASGSIIAGMHNGAYPFVWPRDGIYAAITFVKTGHTNEALNFYKWLRDIASRDIDSGIGDKGFFYQKYSTDGYRIWTAPQVDETASVPWGLWQYFLVTGDLGFLTDFWNLAYTSARASSENSMLDSRLHYNGAYNLMAGMSCWEDAFGLFLYSNGSVVRGLRDAANIADAIPGQSTWATTFRDRANTIQTGIDARIDARVEPSDISQLGLVFPYEVYAPTNARMTNMIEWLHGRQSSGGYTDNLVETNSGTAGLLRRYNHNVNNAGDNYWNGGPWFLATAWYGEYHARWQDYVGGKALIDVSRDKLNLLLDKLGPNGLGAEQIAPSTNAQKYPGFWLQTAWPNVWESHSTMLDQMMLFLDSSATRSTIRVAPKFPTGWTNMSYRNVPFRDRHLDFHTVETSNSTRLDIVVAAIGVNPADLFVEATLRIRPGITPTFTMGSVLLIDTNIGRIRLSAQLATNVGATNTFLVSFGNADSDGDGLPDAWERDNDLNPLSSAGIDGASGDPDGDGFDNYGEFMAGTDPRDKNSLLNILPAAADGRSITWHSVTGRVYQVLSATNVPATFTSISGNIVAINNTTTFTDTNPAAPRRFYRIQLVP